MKNQLSKMLSAFIVSATLFSSSAKAQIIYTDVIPDTTIIQGTVGSASLALDINNDGTIDATITASKSSSNVAVKVSPSAGSQIPMWGPILLAKALDNNVIIGSASPSGSSWNSAQNAVLRQIPIGGGGRGGWMGGNPIPFGEWSTTADRYFAIRFLGGGNWYYGWVRVSVASLISFTVRDYAYNAMPNQPILAGETGCTAPTLTTTASGSLSICSGNNVQFTAVTNAAYLFQWFKDGNPIAGANATTCTAFSSGVYYVKASNSCGDTISTADTVSVFAVDTSVTLSGNTLTAKAASATYQWIDCSSMQPISGATGQTFSPKQSGSYAVIVTENSCSDTSSCYMINSTGIDESISAAAINLYPNPASSHVTIDIGTYNKEVDVTITDVAGEVVYSINTSETQKIEVSTQGFKAGIYIVQIQATDFIAAYKFVVEK